MNAKPTDEQGIILSLISMTIMFVLWFLTAQGYFGPNPVGEPTSYGEPLIVPAGYAFSIWSIIYLALVVFPIYQFFNNKERDPRWRHIRIFYALNVIANGIWLVCASYSWQILTVIIIMFMLYTLVRINDILNEIQASGGKINYWTERFGFSIYFAWVTVATALNVSTALAFYEFSGWGFSELYWSWIILPVIAFIAALVIKKYRDRAVAGVVVWAFIAIVVKQWHLNPSIAYISLGIVFIFLLSIFWIGKPFAKDSNPSLSN